ncbi:hypothetical protein [Halorarum salinum]|uniref:Uncharacterized protein n=1 Tax=Halorarum salinum TaxID=2743089 RepID=A0A7D5QF28_9EURY|nr:hypothetical protein [Halobaculum salinum]QLG63181.1 hypothetical protein HUG12_16160 [Halobaculum salinum]
MSSPSSGGALAHAKAIGHDVEELVVDAIDAFELAYETDAHHDAIVTEPVSCDLEASGGVPVVFVGLVALDVDQLVEVKACVRSASNGDATTPGRWLFKGPDDGQHGALVDEDAVYALAVYREDGASRELLAIAIIPADVVDELVADSWYGVDRRENWVAKLGWTHVLDEEVVRA